MRRTSLSQGFSSIAIAIIIGAIVLVGGAAFYAMRSTSPSSSPSSATTVTSESTTSEYVPTGEVASTLTDIIARGQSMECDWKLPAEAENPFDTGKLWTTANQGRSSIQANINGMTIDANAIYKDNTAYTWMVTNGVKMGFKFSPSEIDSMNSSMTAEQRQQAEQIRQEMIFNCRPWTPDPSKFELPADVEFRST